MANELAKPQGNPIKLYFEREGVRQKFEELMGKRSVGFVTSLLSVVNNNSYLKTAKPETVYMSAMMAATLDLPINPNLGFAYIIPYGDSAQFQMGYKGFIQLALRSGQFKTISSTKVYEGQIVEENPLTGYVFDWSKKASDTVVGYAANQKKTITELLYLGVRFFQLEFHTSGNGEFFFLLLSRLIVSI